MERVFRARSHVRSVIDQDGAVLLDIRRGRYFSLNGIGAVMWRQLEPGVTQSELETCLVTTYEVPREVVSQHCQQFLDRVRGNDLVEVVG